MQKSHDPLGSLRIAAPCKADWAGMAGDERVRHCALCNLNVYNFAEMTRDDVRDLLVRTEGRVCARLYQRADGTVLTRDCPTGLRAMRQRASRAVAALVAAACSLPAFALGKSCEPQAATHGGRVKLEITCAVASQPSVFTGVVRDEGSTPLPGVVILLRDEAAAHSFMAVTDVNGAFSIASPYDGLYRIEVRLAGFVPVSVEHVPLNAGEVTHASVALRTDTTISVSVGILVGTEPLMTRDGGTMTFSREFFNKLPF